MEVEDRLNEEMLETARRAVSSTLATVPGLNPDTEDSLIGEQQWQAIHERRAAGQGVSKIARELELDRKTVRSSLRQSCWKPSNIRCAVAARCSTGCRRPSGARCA